VFLSRSLAEIRKHYERIGRRIASNEELDNSIENIYETDEKEGENHDLGDLHGACVRFACCPDVFC
jgi:hypothetical protein